MSLSSPLGPKQVCINDAKRSKACALVLEYINLLALGLTYARVVSQMHVVRMRRAHTAARRLSSRMLVSNAMK